MRLFLYIFIVTTAYSCISSSDNWNSFSAKELRETNEGFERMLFIDERTGFLFGDYTSDDALESSKHLLETEATLYRTKDGGRSWRRMVFGNGSFRDAFTVDDVIYAVKESYTLKGYNKIRKLYASRNSGQSWTEVINPNFLLTHIALNTTRRTAILGDTVFTITQHQDSLIGTHSLFKKSTNIGIPKGFKPEMIKSNKNDLWLIGYENNKLIFLVRSKNGSFEKIYLDAITTERLFLPDFNVVDNDISLIAVAEASIIGATHKYYKSRDRGRSWTVEEMPSSLYVEPIAFLGKDKVWTYCGTGSIQMRR